MPIKYIKSIKISLNRSSKPLEEAKFLAEKNARHMARQDEKRKPVEAVKISSTPTWAPEIACVLSFKRDQKR